MRFRKRRTLQTVGGNHLVIEVLSIRRAARQRRARRDYKELFETFQRFPLTTGQVRAATSFAQETLVVAGAGSGKTSLLLGRAKYLVESKRASPEEILILAFNRKAADEIGERSKALGLPVRATTFHAFGNWILGVTTGAKAVVFAEDHEVESFIKVHLESMKRGQSEADLLAQFFSMFSAPIREQDSFRDIADHASYVRSLPRTLQGESIKSHGEWAIANWLWINSVSYEYEALYREGSRDEVHKPDFTIRRPDGLVLFVEYFGVDRDGNTAPGIDATKYRETRDWKRSVHHNRGTILIELTYQDLREKTMLRKLREELTAHGVRPTRRPSADVHHAAEVQGYQSRLVKTLQTFLRHARARRLTTDELQRAARDARDECFIAVFSSIYAAYLGRLRELEQPDFAELIHASADDIENGKVQLPYRHIMVDEFQDIAHDRFRLIEAIQRSNKDIDLTLVGDDWQAINGFAGSDIEIMRQFDRAQFGRTRVDLEDTFRLPQSLADAATRFVMTNPAQLTKKIVSSFDEQPSLVLHWDANAADADIERNVEIVVGRIGAPAADPTAELFVLARYSNHLPRQQFLEDLWAGPVHASTIHRSKGLEADYVIILDLKEDYRGFPSTIADDPVLMLVRDHRDEYPHAEERRLLYVAITRARRQTHLITPAMQMSAFAEELRDPAFGATHFGTNTTLECPVCHSGRLATDVFGRFTCSHEPVCEFQPPRCPSCHRFARARSTSPLSYWCEDHPSVEFERCPRCSAGALIRRSGPYGSFDACHLWRLSACTGKRKASIGSVESSWPPEDEPF